jgi:hypothetical protein
MTLLEEGLWWREEGSSGRQVPTADEQCDISTSQASLARSAEVFYTRLLQAQAQHHDSRASPPTFRSE